MVGAVVFLMFLPILISCSGEGNIRLLEDEVAVALKACSNGNATKNNKGTDGNRQRRSSNINSNTVVDFNSNQEVEEYDNENRNITDLREQTEYPNSTSLDYEGYTAGNLIGTPLDSAKIHMIGNYQNATTTRNKRNEPPFDKHDDKQCLSQCVFANLQVVDSRGIPRETPLWNLVQSSVTSQQSRSALHDQIKACFQELQSEAEDNGCSYSNKLERCLMLRFADLKFDAGTKQKAEK